MPFTREILAEYSGLGDRKLDKHLTALVDRGVLGVDAGGGEIRWTVRGELREPGGPETIERFVRVQTLRAEARAKVARQAGRKADREPEPEPEPARDDGRDDGGGGRSVAGAMIRAGVGAARTSLGLVAAAAAPLDGRQAKKPKSLAVSTGLSLLGPLGWLYAGSFREAVPASLLYVALAAIIPNALLWPILWFALPVSALTGLAYAWQHNRKGQRTPLFTTPKKKGDKKNKKG